MKNPSEFYDQDYITASMSKEHPEATRWKDNGLHYASAKMIGDLALATGSRTLLDVGCGRGFVVCHLRNLGFEADGLEYGQAAFKHTVCGARWADLTGVLPVDSGTYDLLSCLGVLTHIGEKAVLHAILELARVSRRWLVTNILATEERLQAHHRTFHYADWWRARFGEAGWKESSEHADLLMEYGHNRIPHIWTAIWRT